MIELSEKTVAIWYIQLDSKSDFLASLIEEEKDKKYELLYRFRYYKDDKAFDSSDEKNWYRLIAEDTREMMLLKVQPLLSKLCSLSDGEFYEYINYGDLEDFKCRFMEAPFISFREERVN